MHSSSFKSPKSYLFGHYLKNSIPVLWRYVIMAQSNPILLHTEGNGCFFFWLAVTFNNTRNNCILKVKSIIAELDSLLSCTCINLIKPATFPTFVSWSNVLVVVHSKLSSSFFLRLWQKTTKGYGVFNICMKMNFNFMAQISCKLTNKI